MKHSMKKAIKRLLKRKNTLRIKAYTLLIVFAFDLARPYALKAGNLPAAAIDGPVASAANNYVDLFTGDFHYSVPLMVVPGPNGEAVDITAGYHSGIRMEEKASWIGLGWNYSPGEITRSIVGAADDCNGQTVLNYSFHDINNTYDINRYSEVATFGPVYYKNFHTNPTTYSTTSGSSPVHKKSYDIFVDEIPVNRQDITTLPFNIPGYDRYFVSGPGIGGQLRPVVNPAQHLVSYVDPSYNPTLNNSTASMDFVFENQEHQVMKGYYIKYYTNSDINNTSSSVLYSNSTHIGFLDYQTQNTGSGRRPATSFGADDIGGIEVTNVSGVTYHYSLPVYTRNEFDISIGINSSGNPDRGMHFEASKKLSDCVTSWKLTSVTGSDYEDSNNNYKVDEGDKGYWVAYEYSLWSGGFNWSSSFFKYHQDISPNGFPHVTTVKQGGTGDYIPEETFYPNASIARATNEIYYLDKIKTSTHTAFFVKDLRMDEHSYDKILNSSNKPIPQLKLSKIILLRNEDASLFTNSGTFPTDSRFDLASCGTTTTGFVHIGKYNAAGAAIDLKTLKSASFTTDYSLCQKLHNNINNSFTTTSFNFDVQQGRTTGEVQTYTTQINPSQFLYASINTPTYGSDGGKLTLKEIVTKENGAAKVFPSYKFDYGSNNPDYDPDKIDLFGNYNPNYQAGYSHYRLNSSGIDSWNLVKITTPLGGEITVNYEADRYEQVWSNDDPTGLKLIKPSYIFLITAAGKCRTDASSGYHQISQDFRFLEGDFGNYYGDVSISSSELRVPVKTHCLGVLAGLNYYGYCVGNLVSGSSSGGVWNFPGSGISLTGYAGVSVYSCSQATYTGLDCSGTSFYPTTYYSNYSPYDYGYGYVIMPLASGNSMYGGGVRVNNIQIKDPQSNETYQQKYEYGSGICSANPDRVSIKSFAAHRNTVSADIFSDGVGVGYEEVVIKTTVYGTSQTNGSTVYTFDTQSTIPTFTLQANGYGGNPLRGVGGGFSCTSCGGSAIYYKHPVIGTMLVKNTGPCGLNGKLRSVHNLDAQDRVISYTYYTYDYGSTIAQYCANSCDYADANCTIAPLPMPCSIVCNGQVHTACGTHMANASYALDTYIADKSVFLKSTETHKDGIVTKTEILQRDPNTGAPTEVSVEDPTVGGIVNKTEFAYTRMTSSLLTYPYMGLKSCSGCESNMNNLVSVSESRTIKYPMRINTNGNLYADKSAPGFLIGGTQNSFTNQPPYRVYNSGNGHFEMDNSVTKPFYKPHESFQLAIDADVLETQSTLNWRKVGEATAFNSNTQGAQEAKGLNGRYASAIKMGYKDQFKVADISDANLNSFAFTSFEDGGLYGNSGNYYGGEISGTSMQVKSPAIYLITIFNTTIPFPIFSHTGEYMAKVPASSYGPTFSTINFEKDRTYRASVWVTGSSAATYQLVASLDGSVGGTPQTITTTIAQNNSNNITVSGWQLLQADITVPASYTATGGSLNDLRFFVNNTGGYPIYVDDFSIHPVDAPINGYVYNPATGWLTATLDNENFATRYTYDQAGRVIRVDKETKNGFKKISETAYHFGRP